MKSKLPAEQSDGQLETLAAEIQEHFELGERAYGTALEHARAIGERLVAAKDLAGHGNWKPWVEAKCDFSMDTAERFMKVHREWNLLKSAPVRILGIRDAVAYITAEKKRAKHDTLTGGKDDEKVIASKRATDPVGSDVGVAQQDNDLTSTCIAQATCPNSESEFDEDGICVWCSEQQVVPDHKAEREPADEVVIEGDVTVEDDYEPCSTRDCYVDPADADFFCSEEPLDEDAMDRLEVQLEMMEHPLTMMLEHEAVEALSEHDPLRVSLNRLERAMMEVSAALERKRPICLDGLLVA